MLVFRLLGGKSSRITVYATGGYLKKGTPITACAADLKAFFGQGYTAVKLKVGHHTLEKEVKADDFHDYNSCLPVSKKQRLSHTCHTEFDETGIFMRLYTRVETWCDG